MHTKIHKIFQVDQFTMRRVVLVLVIASSGNITSSVIHEPNMNLCSTLCTDHTNCHFVLL